MILGFFFDYLSMCITIIKCILISRILSMFEDSRLFSSYHFFVFFFLIFLRLVQVTLFLSFSSFLLVFFSLLRRLFFMFFFYSLFFELSFYFLLFLPSSFLLSFLLFNNTVLFMPLSRQNLTFCLVKLISFKFHSESPSYLIWDLWCNHTTNWMSHGW